MSEDYLEVEVDDELHVCPDCGELKLIDDDGLCYECGVVYGPGELNAAFAAAIYSGGVLDRATPRLRRKLLLGAAGLAVCLLVLLMSHSGSLHFGPVSILLEPTRHS